MINIHANNVFVSRNFVVFDSFCWSLEHSDNLALNLFWLLINIISELQLTLFGLFYEPKQLCFWIIFVMNWITPYGPLPPAKTYICCLKTFWIFWTFCDKSNLECSIFSLVFRPSKFEGSRTLL